MGEKKEERQQISRGDESKSETRLNDFAKRSKHIKQDGWRGMEMERRSN